MTEQQVEQHFEALDLSAMQPGGSDFFTAADVTAKPAEVIGKICGIYGKVRPFLEMAGGVPLIPKKWRAALKSYIALMDVVCPG